MGLWLDLAPVHSIAAALFLKPQEIHHFEDIGYFHAPFSNCPADASDRCACNPNDGNNFGTSLSFSVLLSLLLANIDFPTSKLRIGNIGTRVPHSGWTRSSDSRNSFIDRHRRNFAIDIFRKFPLNSSTLSLLPILTYRRESQGLWRAGTGSEHSTWACEQREIATNRVFRKSQLLVM